MNKKRFFLCLMLLILWILFIFARSCKPYAASAQESESVRQPLSQIVHSPLSAAFVRKLAHFTEFCLLGVLSAALFCTLCQKTPLLFVYANMLGLAVALCDETIQLFVPGRVGMITDVWIDESGVLTGTLFALIVRLLLKNKTKRKKKQDPEAPSHKYRV